MKTRTAAVNVRFLLLLILLVAIVGGGAVGARLYQKRARAANALAAAEKATAAQQWETAYEEYITYLKQYPDDEEVLRKYATAVMNTRPRLRDHLGRAVTAYRRILRSSPDDKEILSKLFGVYRAVRNYSDMQFVARKQAEKSTEAMLALAYAKLGQEKVNDAKSDVDDVLNQLKNVTAPNEQKTNAYVLRYQIAKIEHPDDMDAQRLPLREAIDFDPNAFDPQSLLAQLYREKAREVMRKTQQPDTESMNKAREILVRIQPQNAMQDIIIGNEWLQHRELEKAQEFLDTAQARPDPVAIPNGFPVTSDWLLAQFTLQSRIALSKGELPANGTDYVQKTLDAFEAREYRFRAEPEAIQMYLLEFEIATREGDTARAQRALADATRTNQSYRESVAAMPVKPSANLIAFLDGLLAHARGDYYEAIKLIEPLVQDLSTVSPELCALLSDAFGKTGQIRRAVRAMERVQSTGGRLSRGMRDQLFAWYVELEDFERAYKETKENWNDISDDDLTRQARKLWAAIEYAQRAPAERNELLAGVEGQLEKLELRHGNAPDLVTLRSQLAAARGDTRGAEETLRDRLAERPTADLHFELASLYQETDRIDLAIEELKKAVSVDPENLRCWLRLGDLYTMTREFENASNAFLQGRESAETREEQREFDLKIASVAFDRGDTSTGISRLREIMRNEPADDRDMTVRALLMTKLDLVKDRPVAEAIVAEMREIEGEAGLTWRVWSADILLTNHASAAERERILDSLQSVLAADPNHAGAICLLGKAYEQGRDWRAAETLYSNAWKRNPDNFEITYAYLNFLKSRGRDSELMDVVMQSKAVPNEVRSARRATELVQQDRPEEAIRMLQEHAETEPDDIPSRVLLAMLQFDKSKDESAAFAALDQIEADNGPSPSVARARVALLTELDRMDEAKKLIDARIEEAPKDYSLRETRGLLLHMMGDSEAALRDFQMLPELTTAGNAEGLIRFGQYLLEIGRVDEALELWERGLRDYPQSTLLRRNFVKALFYRNQPQDYARAAELIDSLEAATRSHVDPELMMFRALSMLDRRESPTAARELLTRALELNPTLHEAELALIRIEVMLGDLGSARRIAQAGIQKLAPTSTGGSLKVDELQHLGRLRTALAQIEEQAGDFAAAERLARLALDVDATNVEALELLFRASIAPSGDRNLTPVLRLVDQALAGAPYSQKLRILRSRILSTTGNVDQATAEIAKFIAENPEEAHAATYLQLANLREMQGDREGVAKAVQNAVEKEPRSYEAQNARIIFFGQTRDYKSIENLIPELMDGNHDAALSIVAAGQLVTASEPQYKELARKLLQSATARFAPDDAKQLIIGKLFYQLGDLDTTIKIYETFREKNPEHITALNDLAWFLGMERNRYDEAIALADRGVNLSPRHAELRDTRGNILYKNSKYVAAMVDFEVCAEAGLAQTQRARTQLMIARCASRLNDHEKARRAAEQALELAKGPNDLTEEENRELQELVVRQS